MASPEKIANLIAPFGVALSEAQLTQFAVYLDLLARWNAKVNLTAVRSPAQMVTRHFGESLFAAKLICKKGISASLIDLGSGAGFPGLPFAIYSPTTKVTLIESRQKKATFLKEVARTIPLGNVAIFDGRGEDFAGQAEVVTMRAVERFDQSVLVGWKLVQEQGSLALLIGADQEAATRQAIPQAKWETAVRLPGSDNRVVLIAENH